MTFVRSIVTLFAVCLCVGTSYAIGHGLSTGEPRAFITGAVMLGIGAGIIFGITRNRPATV